MVELVGIPLDHMIEVRRVVTAHSQGGQVFHVRVAPPPSAEARHVGEGGLLRRDWDGRVPASDSTGDEHRHLRAVHRLIGMIGAVRIALRYLGIRHCLNLFPRPTAVPVWASLG